MKYLIFFALILFASCGEESNTYADYTEKSESQINALTPPVILIAKSKSFGLYGITVIDSNGKLLTVGNVSSLANNIGESRSIGDTLIK